MMEAKLEIRKAVVVVQARADESLNESSETNGMIRGRRIKVNVQSLGTDG